MVLVISCLTAAVETCSSAAAMRAVISSPTVGRGEPAGNVTCLVAAEAVRHNIHPRLLVDPHVVFIALADAAHVVRMGRHDGHA
jgi:hypothetical protein